MPIPGDLSVKAYSAWHYIANFGALRVPFDDNDTPAIVWRPSLLASGVYDPEPWQRAARPADFSGLPVDWDTARELMESGLLGILTRRKHLYRIGWQDVGLDGTQAEFWLPIQ